MNLHTLHIFEHHNTSHHGWSWFWTWGRTPPHWTVFIWTWIFRKEPVLQLEAVRARQAAVQSALTEYPQIPRTEDSWCTCGRYVLMASEDVCCKEWGFAEETLLELETRTRDEWEMCLATHSDFQPHIEPAVLRTFFGWPGSTGMIGPKVLVASWARVSNYTSTQVKF